MDHRARTETAQRLTMQMQLLKAGAIVIGKSNLSVSRATWLFFERALTNTRSWQTSRECLHALEVGLLPAVR